MRHCGRRSLSALAILAVFPAWATAQRGVEIAGRVRNERGVSLQAASITIAGLTRGALTDSAGRYAIRLPEARADGGQLIVTARLLGYRAQSRATTLSGAVDHLDFVLHAVPLRLSEVVVTGEGTRAVREKLGNTVNSVAPDEIAGSNESNIVNALAAKAPNVEVTSAAGDPGAGASILIRGYKTIEGTGQPLFVVDGTPVDNSTITTLDPSEGTALTNRAADINPADIASVEILKGPAASAIYGTRGAQGVVLITTRHGTAGPVRYALRSSYTWDEATHGIPLQRRFGQGSEGAADACAVDRTIGCTATAMSWGPPLARDAYVESLTSAGCDAACAATRVDARFPNGVHAFDHYAELFHAGHTFDNDLTMAGGDSTRQFYLSAGRLAQTGTIVGPNSWYDRSTLRLNAAQALSHSVRVSANVAYADSRGAFIPKGNNTSGLLLDALRTPPDFDNRQYTDPANGLHRSYQYPHPANLVDSRIFDNPFWTINRNRATSDVNRVYGNVQGEYAPVPWLNVRYWLGVDFYSEDRVAGYVPSSSQVPVGNGQLVQGNYRNTELDHNLVVTASKTFSERLAGTLTLGQNLNSTHFQRLQAAGFGFAAPDLFTLSNTAVLIPQNDETLVHTESYFAQLTADLYDQLYLTGTVRDEGSSTFGRDNRHHLFPKASAAWTFTRLTGGHGWLTFGKVRAAYGEAGREPDPYQILTLYDPANLNANPGLVSDPAAGQRHLRPERTRELEVGTDLGFLGHRADAGVTFYDSRTVDAIFALPVAGSSGYSTELRNGATISNRGWEVTMNVHPVQATAVQWDVGFQWAHNTNRALHLEGASFLGFGNQLGPSAVVPGYALGVIYSSDFVRCRYREPNIQATSLGASTPVNDVCHAAHAPDGALFIDADGFPLPDATAHVIGNPNPAWTGSVHTTLAFGRRWQLSGLLDVRHGGDVWNGTRGALQLFGTHAATAQRASCTLDAQGEERCTGNMKVFGRGGWFDGPVVGPGAGMAVPIGENWYREGLGNTFDGPDTQIIEDGGFVKLREIAVAYTLDNAFVRKTLGLTDIAVRLAGRNLHTWTRYTGVDPETNLAGSATISRGIDYFDNPQTRSMVLTIELHR